MTIYIFLLKGDLNGKIVVVRFFFFRVYMLPAYSFECAVKESRCTLSLHGIVHLNFQRGGGGAGGSDPQGKSQVAIGFLRNTGTDPLEKQLDLGPVASRGRFVRPSINEIS